MDIGKQTVNSRLAAELKPVLFREFLSEEDAVKLIEDNVHLWLTHIECRYH
jgi:hypothetical protein